jgi:hypothetical protein
MLDEVKRPYPLHVTSEVEQNLLPTACKFLSTKEPTWEIFIDNRV